MGTVLGCAMMIGFRMPVSMRLGLGRLGCRLAGFTFSLQMAAVFCFVCAVLGGVLVGSSFAREFELLSYNVVRRS
jgi:hypothetical protein